MLFKHCAVQKQWLYFYVNTGRQLQQTSKMSLVAQYGQGKTFSTFLGKAT